MKASNCLNFLPTKLQIPIDIHFQKTYLFYPPHPGFLGGGVIGVRGSNFLGNSNIFDPLSSRHSREERAPSPMPSPSQPKSIPLHGLPPYDHRAHIAATGHAYRGSKPLRWTRGRNQQDAGPQTSCDDLLKWSRVRPEKNKSWAGAAAASSKATRPSRTPSRRYLTDFRA